MKKLNPSRFSSAFPVVVAAIIATIFWTSTSSASDTRIISVTGSTAYGAHATGTSTTVNATISNTGNSTLTVTGITLPSGFSGSYSGLIAAAGSATVPITFSPTSVGSYSGKLTVASNATSGTGTLSVSGSGTAPLTRIITVTGNLAFGTHTTGTSATANVTISNTGNSALTVTGIVLPAGFSGSYSGTIGSGDSATVTVTFSALATAVYSGSLSVNSNATSGTAILAASGTGTAPVTRIISVTGNLAFGAHTTGTLTTSNVTIGNSGSAALTVTGITLPSGFSGSYAGSISAGGSASVAVTFSPTSVASYSGNLVVASNATSGTATLAVSGSGTALPTRIISVAGNLAFGAHSSGSSSTANVTIRNNGNSSLHITGIELPSGFSGYYSGSLPSGSFVNVTVTFSPISVGAYSGNLTVDSDATSGSASLAVSGTGTPAPTRVVSVTGIVAFGPHALGTSTPTNVTISNSGNSDLTVTGITLPAGFSGSFSGTIPAGGSTTIVVTFSPTDVTTYSGNLSVASNATSGTGTLALSGTGTPVVYSVTLDQSNSTPLTLGASTAITGTIRANGVPAANLRFSVVDGISFLSLETRTNSQGMFSIAEHPSLPGAGILEIFINRANVFQYAFTVTSPAGSDTLWLQRLSIHNSSTAALRIAVQIPFSASTLAYTVSAGGTVAILNIPAPTQGFVTTSYSGVTTIVGTGATGAAATYSVSSIGAGLATLTVGDSAHLNRPFLLS